MANSKNTIQNIPLEAELCMNQLRTETKQFKGYNEKNTTLYGGTLSPMYESTLEVGVRPNRSKVLFSKDGTPFTVENTGSAINVYKENSLVYTKGNCKFTQTIKMDVATDAVGATYGRFWEGGVSTITVDRLGTIKIFDNNDNLVQTVSDVWDKSTSGFVMRAQIFQLLDGTDNSYGIVMVSEKIVDTGGERYNLGAVCINCYSYQGYHFTKSAPKYTTLQAFPKTPTLAVENPTDELRGDGPIAFGKIMPPSGSTYKVDVSNCSGLVNWIMPNKKPTRKTIDFSFVNEGNYYHFESNSDWETVSNPENDYPIQFPTLTSSDNIMSGFNMKVGDSETEPIMAYELYQFAARGRRRSGMDFYLDNNPNPVGYTGHRGDYFIGCPLCGGSDWTGYDASDGVNKDYKFYYLDGKLISICYKGLPINVPNFNDAVVSFSHYLKTVCFRTSDGWYRHSVIPTVSGQDIKIRDGRYVLIQTESSYYLDIFDIETCTVLPENDIGWINWWPPYQSVVATGSNLKTGAVYGAGVNAGYEVSGSPWVGYLRNAFLMYDFPYAWERSYSVGVNDYTETLPLGPIMTLEKENSGLNRAVIQYYYTIGNNAQSAAYAGSDPTYFNTKLPEMSNIIIPIPTNAKIIEGYSNNDLVKAGSRVYPLMYYNNSQRIYAFMMLAVLGNIDDVFSVQGQQYATDDNNIYALTYNNGVISNPTAVAYKKNLTFLGTLPAQVVFWSSFNKTFYAFTGDRVLSKMFEASDINEIYYVGQNPSTLSLWICSDTGIYIISDTDMFKLDYVSNGLEFLPDRVKIVSDGDTLFKIYTLSLYKITNDQEMIPVKLETSYYGLGNEMKAVMDCWYLRLFDENNTKGYVKAKVHTITDITRHTEEKTFEVNPSDYDENHIVYLRFQPKYQECVSMQLELETNLGIYQISLGVNTTDSTAQVSKFNF